MAADAHEENGYGKEFESASSQTAILYRPAWQPSNPRAYRDRRFGAPRPTGARIALDLFWELLVSQCALTRDLILLQRQHLMYDAR